VATRVAGVPLLIDHEENGLLIEPGKEAELTGQLARLLQDDALRSRLAHAGREKIEAKHSFAKRMQKIRGIYDEVLRNC
jgi:glycosyltransferase involved in cell wall biosynthesis